MNFISRRTWVLLGTALATSLVGWSLKPPPRSARAALPSTTLAPALTNVEDIAPFLRNYRSQRMPPEQVQLPLTMRDLFALPTLPLEPEHEHSHQSPATEAVPPAVKRKLDGVVLGPTPLASIDGRLYSLNAMIDGFTLTEIRRDEVVLRDGEREVVLLLQLPWQKPN